MAIKIILVTLQVLVGYRWFLLGGWNKVLRPLKAHVKWVETLKVIPRWLHQPIGLLMPLTELTLGVSLVSGAFGMLAPIAAIGLLLVFNSVITLILVRGIRVDDCGCASKPNAEMITWKTARRNLLLMAIFAAPVALHLSIGYDLRFFLGHQPLWPTQMAVVASVVALMVAIAAGLRRRVIARAKAAAESTA